jgi:YggT family protein
VLISVTAQALYIFLYVLFMTLIARFVMSYVLAYGRRWRPRRLAAATLEVVWSVTDLALRPLRRVIPPLRLGTVSVDLSAMVLLLILSLLMNFALVPLFS